MSFVSISAAVAEDTYLLVERERERGVKARSLGDYHHHDHHFFARTIAISVHFIEMLDERAKKKKKKLEAQEIMCFSWHCQTNGLEVEKDMGKRRIDESF